MTNYSAPSIDGPLGITPGSDGALWFANDADNSIGRITTAGVVTNFTGTGIDGPEDIAAGDDGALWFTNSVNNSIGRITTAGTVTNYTDPTIDSPLGITDGPDGALWFTNNMSQSIGRITTGGVVTNYTNSSIGFPYGITSGSDGALWFTNRNNSIGRITTPNNNPTPTVTKVSPNSGPTTGGTSITITGTGFVSGATVAIGQGSGLSGAIAATNVNVVSPTEITATTGGAAKAGTFSLFVTTSGGTSAANAGDNFTYNIPAVVPTVTAVSPNSGPIAGGTPITINGTGFIPGARVVIGQGSGSGPTAIAATSVDVVSSTEITATTGGGAKAGTWSLFVITSGGTSAGNSADDFTYK